MEGVFIDTNVLIYAHDSRDAAKQATAVAALEGLWSTGRGCLSTQVLQEFYVVATGKCGLDNLEARDLIEDFSSWPVHAISAPDVLDGVDLAARRQISLWDSLIVVAARRLGASVILTEDFQHGSEIEGIRLENPFV